MFIFRNENIDSTLPHSPKQMEKEVMPTCIVEKHVPILGEKAQEQLIQRKTLVFCFVAKSVAAGVICSKHAS